MWFYFGLLPKITMATAAAGAVVAATAKAAQPPVAMDINAY